MRSSFDRLAARRSGFTLVEMLVVIAIIGILAALLLSAILRARDTALRMSCSNNLRNLSLAVLEHDIAKGKLPAASTFLESPNYAKPATWTAASPANTLSWVHEILPYIEKQDVRGALEATLETGGAVPSIAVTINLLLCPSDETDDAVSPLTGLRYSQLSYACNAGVLDNHSVFPPVNGFDWPANGVFETRLKGTVDRISFKNPTLGNVPDGSSNTILLSENTDLEQWNHVGTEAQYAILWDDDDSNGVPNQKLNRRPDYAGTPPDTKPDSLDRSKFPLEWLASQAAVVGSPQNDSLAYARPASNHGAGFMVAFCDGRVKFVSETIAYETYAKIMTSNGKKYLKAGLPKSASNPPPSTQWPLNVQTGPISDDEF